MRKKCYVLCALLCIFALLLQVAKPFQVFAAIQGLGIDKGVALANEAIYESFSYRNDGTWIYPDEFAGTYLEDGELVIGLTSLSKENLDKYYKLVAEHTEKVRFSEKLHSIGELSHLGDEIASYLITNGCRPVGYCTIDKENNLLFQISERLYETAVTGMVSTTVISTPSSGGDSGGPYFSVYLSPGSAPDLVYCGIHCAGNGTNTYFTPYSTVYYETGFSLATYGN